MEALQQAVEIKELHYIAYHLYRDRQYEQACNFFYALLDAQPDEPKYWTGLGACLQMTKQMEEAIRCYAEAQRLQKDKPDPYLYVYAADCYFALKQTGEGLQALNAAWKIAEVTQDARILKHVLMMRKMWK